MIQDIGGVVILILGLTFIAGLGYILFFFGKRDNK